MPTETKKPKKMKAVQYTGVQFAKAGPSKAEGNIYTLIAGMLRIVKAANYIIVIKYI